MHTELLDRLKKRRKGRKKDKPVEVIGDSTRKNDIVKTETKELNGKKYEFKIRKDHLNKNPDKKELRRRKSISDGINNKKGERYSNRSGYTRNPGSKERKKIYYSEDKMIRQKLRYLHNTCVDKEINRLKEKEELPKKYKFKHKPCRDYDPATEFAFRVMDNDIVSGPHIRNQAQRHINDLKRSDIIYEPNLALDNMNFWDEQVYLDGERIVLLPWQEFVLCSLSGWIRPDGNNRFTTLDLYSGKGSGKSPFMASLLLFKTFYQGEKNCEGIVVAPVEKQARIVIRDARQIINSSQLLSEELSPLGGARPNMISSKNSESNCHTVAADKIGVGGFRANCVIIDEYSEFTDSYAVDNLEKAFKKHLNPLLVIASNAGVGEHSPSRLNYKHAIDVASGKVEEDFTLPMIFSLDKDDDPDNEEVWIKTNPSLPVTPGYEYLRKHQKAAENFPAKRGMYLRLAHMIWQDSVNDPFIDFKLLDKVTHETIIKEGDCFCGLDLSLKGDLTAGALIWVDSDNILNAELTFWIPSRGLSTKIQKHNIQYEELATQGYINLIPGSIIDYGVIADWMKDKIDNYKLKNVAYDPHYMDYLVRDLTKAGIDAVDPSQDAPGENSLIFYSHPQGFYNSSKELGLSMSASITKLEEYILSEKIRIKENPLLRSAFLGAEVKKDQSNNRRFDKHNSASKIDGLIALTIAVGLADKLLGNSGDPYLDSLIKGTGSLIGASDT